MWWGEKIVVEKRQKSEKWNSILIGWENKNSVIQGKLKYNDRFYDINKAVRLN